MIKETGERVPKYAQHGVVGENANQSQGRRDICQSVV